jgi:hypothetical protein
MEERKISKKKAEKKKKEKEELAKIQAAYEDKDEMNEDIFAHLVQILSIFLMILQGN